MFVKNLLGNEFLNMGGDMLFMETCIVNVYILQYDMVWYSGRWMVWGGVNGDE